MRGWEFHLKKYIFQSLFEGYQLPLYRYLLQMTRNKEQAEELLQETFYRALISLKVKDVTSARAWLFKVARNLYIDSVRKSSTEAKLLEQMKIQYRESKFRLPEDEVILKSRQEELEERLNQLPERMRSVLYLREVQGLSYKELEVTLSLTNAQVKSTLFRARAKFRELEIEKRKGEPSDG
ncbi:RNA polymerase sigma factor [Oceanobacillus sp. CAU 1775]